MLVLNEPERVRAYVASLTGKPFALYDTAIGVADRDGTLTGGMVFTTYTGSCVEVSLAGKGSISREAWGACVRYVFGQLGCSRLQLHTARRNPVRKQLSRSGFVFEGPCKRLYGDEDGLRYALTIDELPAFVSRWKI